MGVDKVKLVVGLGNPDKKYRNTRHNIGFMFLDYITDGVEFSLNNKFNALEYEMTIDNEKVLFIKPLSYMNLSGEVVKEYVNYYKVDLENLLVIQDDLDMDLGKYKLLYNHGDGGHNGIKDIISKVNSKKFLRLKYGISKADIATKDYVLGKFNKVELNIIYETFDKMTEFIKDFVNLNMDLLMNKYNRR